MVLSGGRIENQTHGNEAGVVKAMSLKEGLGFVGELVGEQGDAFEIFLTGKIDDRLEEEGTITLAAVVGMDDDVFHNENEATHSSGNSKKQISHPYDAVLCPHHKYPTSRRFFENVADAFFLQLRVGNEIVLKVEQIDHEVSQGREVLDGSRFDLDIREHAGFWAEIFRIEQGDFSGKARLSKEMAWLKEGVR